MACPALPPGLSSYAVATATPMPISDEKPSDGQLPQLPDLPGIAGFDAGQPAEPRVDSEASVDAENRESDSAVAVGIAMPEADVYLGKAFGGYRLESRIGQGGMGTVYKGRQVSLDRVVAVKILNKALYENREFIKRFEREAKSIAKINHPNIVAVYDFGVHDGLWYMVNEFIEGQSLSKIIGDRLVVGINEVVTWMVHCLAGLAHVGQGNIVHRDIKPDNILVTRDGVAKIADFGLAKDVSERNDSTDLTAVGLAMGTPAYMSPEQCMGRKLDGRSDQYSLGVTAYFALTGEKPFTGQSSFEIMTRQREHIPPPPHQLNPSVPPEVSGVVMRMLAKDSADRYADASACREAWLEVGTALGCFGAVRRSGEFEVPAGLLSANSPPAPPPGEPRKSARMRSDPALPALPSSVAPLTLVDAPPPAARSAPENRSGGDHRHADPGPVAPVQRRPGTDAPGASRTSGEHSFGGDRPSSERHRPPSISAALTCPKCGHLNRADAVSCSRCTAPLREGNAGSNRDQEGEALRLGDLGRHREAAAIYARLADRETDKRAKSILRAKEREARSSENERQLAELTQRAHALRDRGDILGAIALLEQGQRLSGESPAISTASPGSDGGLATEIADLRARLSAAKRRRMVLVGGLVLALATVVVALVLWRWGGADTHKGAAAPTVVAP